MGREANPSDINGAPTGETSAVCGTPLDLGWRPLAMIFIAALMLRGVVLFELSQTPFFSSLLGDSMGYHVWAERLAAGDWLGGEVFYQAPLYPYLLGILYSVFGPDPLVAKLAQILLEAFSCVLLAGAGARFSGSARVGILAGALCSLYAPTIFFTTIVQKASLGFFLTALVLNLLSRITRTIRSPTLLLLGASLGLLALTRENALIFILIIVPWLAVQYRRVSLRTRATWIALLLFGASIPLVSVGLRNYRVGGEFALTTSQFGTNFFIGNNANARGFYLPLRLFRGNVKHERDDAIEMAEAAAGRDLSPREVSEFWTGRALDYIKSNPIEWLGLMGRKTLLVWNAVEASDSEDIAVYRHFSWMLDALARVFNFGTIVSLAVAGLWLTRGRWREFGLLYVMIAAYAASLTLFFLFARYRVPLIPLTMIFAAIGAEELRTLVGRGDPRALFQTGLVIACAALVAHLPLTDTQKQRAVTYKNFGAAMIEAERFSEAVEYLGKSLSYRPDLEESLRGMAESLANLDRLPESREYFERVLELEPDDFLSHLGLGQVALLQGKTEEGIRLVELATELEPSDHRPYYLLGMHYAHEGDLPRAIDWLRLAALREDGEYIAKLELSKALYRIGDKQGAEAEVASILRRDPDNAGAVMLLASLLDEDGQLARALVLYRNLLQLQPANARALARAASIDRTIRLRKRIEDLEVAVQNGPNDLDSIVQLSIAYYQAEQWDDAKLQLRNALRLEPSNANHYRGLAEIAAKTGDLEEAESQLRKAVAVESPLALSHLKLGMVLTKMQRLDEAGDEFREAARLEPGSPLSHFQLGRLAEMEERIGSARIHYSRALEIEPGHTGSQEALRRLESSQMRSPWSPR
jgi:tetratricopeptide (TPR) repeat protein